MICRRKKNSIPQPVPCTSCSTRQTRIGKPHCNSTPPHSTTRPPPPPRRAFPRSCGKFEDWRLALRCPADRDVDVNVRVLHKNKHGKKPGVCHFLRGAPNMVVFLALLNKNTPKRGTLKNNTPAGQERLSGPPSVGCTCLANLSRDAGCSIGPVSKD